MLAARPEGLTETLTVPGAVPLAGETTNQLPLLDAAAVKAAPLPETAMGCEAGAELPTL